MMAQDVRVTGGWVKVVALLALLVPSSVSATDRMPTGKWIVEFADHDCLMSRQFGTHDDSLILAIRMMPMATNPTLFVVRSSRDKEPSYGKARLTFGASELPMEAGYGAYGLANRNLRRIKMSVTQEQLDSMKRAGRVTIDIPHEVTDSFHLSSLPDVLRLGQQCAVGLGEEWGFAAEDQIRVKTSPKGDLAAMVSSDDYPSDALSKLEDGQTQARLTIEPDGKPSECIVMNSSGSNSIDEKTCSVAKRARFTPALDAAGEPVRGLVIFTLNWVI